DRALPGGDGCFRSRLRVDNVGRELEGAELARRQQGAVLLAGAFESHEARDRHQHRQANLLRRRRCGEQQQTEEGAYCAAPPAHGDITSFMPVNSPVAGSRTMQHGLAKPSGEIWLATSVIGSLAAIACL